MRKLVISKDPFVQNYKIETIFEIDGNKFLDTYQYIKIDTNEIHNCLQLQFSFPGNEILEIIFYYLFLNYLDHHNLKCLELLTISKSFLYFIKKKYFGDDDEHFNEDYMQVHFILSRTMKECFSIFELYFSESKGHLWMEDYIFSTVLEITIPNNFEPWEFGPCYSLINLADTENVIHGSDTIATSDFYFGHGTFAKVHTGRSHFETALVCIKISI